MYIVIDGSNSANCGCDYHERVRSFRQRSVRQILMCFFLQLLKVAAEVAVATISLPHTCCTSWILCWSGVKLAISFRTRRKLWRKTQLHHATLSTMLKVAWGLVTRIHALCLITGQPRWDWCGDGDGRCEGTFVQSAGDRGIWRR